MVTSLRHGGYCNPSSGHKLGKLAKSKIETARGQIAKLINATEDSQVLLCSGGSESINTALKGVASSYKRRNGKCGHIITSEIEHFAVLESCSYLESIGHEVTRLSANELGIVPVKSVIEAIKDNTFMISLMHANNEVGSLNPIEEIAAGKVYVTM